MTTTLPVLTRLFAVLASLAAFVLTAGCHGTAYPVSTTWPLAGTVWKLVRINGEAVATNRLPGMIFDAKAGKVSGFAGVNNFSGAYTLKEGALSFGPQAVTRKAGPAAETKVETAFLQALAGVTAWKIESNELILTAGDKEVARLQGMPAGSLL